MSDSHPKIEHHTQVNGTPAVALAIRGHHELLEAGLAGPYTLVAWDDQALVATQEGAPIGCLLYRDIEWKKQYFIDLGYVLPEWRSRGVYRALWEELVRRAQKDGRLTIEGATHVNNHRMQAIMEELGRTPLDIGYTFPVPPETAPENP